jgi:DNA-binding transcriptional LysR family regulator
MHYTLHQLKVFSTIVETKSITKAAQQLNLTQPAVSIQFKNFQDQFEIPLIEITGKKLKITSFGYEIAKEANTILNHIEAIDYKMHAHKGYLAGKIKFSSVSTGKYVLPYFLTAFTKQYPKIELSIDVSNKQQVLESIENNEVDFALVSIKPDNNLYLVEPLLPNHLFFVAPTSLGSTQEVKNKILGESIRFIYREKGSGTRVLMERFLSRQDINSKNSLELTSNEAVKQAVLAELGCSIMPLIGIKNELQSNELQIITTEGLPLKSEWNLIYRADKELSPAAQEYLRFLREKKAGILDKEFSWIEEYLRFS